MIDRHPSVDPVHPGEILREDVLPALSMSKTAVADALKISRQTLYDILNEKQPVTAEMAVRFGKLFGNGPNLWINLQRAYDLAIAQRAVDVSGYRLSKRHHRLSGAARVDREVTQEPDAHVRPNGNHQARNLFEIIVRLHEHEGLHPRSRRFVGQCDIQPVGSRNGRSDRGSSPQSGPLLAQ